MDHQSTRWKIKIMVVCDMMLCNLLGTCLCFRGTCSLYWHGIAFQKNIIKICLAMKHGTSSITIWWMYCLDELYYFTILGSIVETDDSEMCLLDFWHI